MLARLPFILFIILAAALGGFLYLGKSVEETRLDTPLPPITMQVYNEGKQSPADTKVTLYNIFASWCTPCIAELPHLAELGLLPGVSIVGIDWQDKPAVLEKWLEKHGNPFDRIYLDADGSYGIGLGMRGLPETYLVDAKGVIRYHHVGPVTPQNMAELRKQIEAAMP